VVAKHSRRLSGFGDAVLSLYAKGMTTGDIANHLADIYGTEVSRDLVSRVTDAIVEDMQAWQSRPLDACYPVVLIDAIVLNIRDGQVRNRPVYVPPEVAVHDPLADLRVVLASAPIEQRPAQGGVDVPEDLLGHNRPVVACPAPQYRVEPADHGHRVRAMKAAHLCA
jgi:hypothetical protein